MQEIRKFNKDINVFPNNMEKYMAFMIDRDLIFIDSFQFMNISLSKLANNLQKDGFYHTKKWVWLQQPWINNKRKVYIPMIIWTDLINSKKKGHYP